jgi:elongation factor 1 alpha-like protein
VDRPLRVTVSDVFRSPVTGLSVSGKVEAGWLVPHAKLLVCPGGATAAVRSLTRRGAPAATAATAGDAVEVALGGVDEVALAAGHVLTWPSHPIPVVSQFKAQIMTLPALQVPVVKGHAFVLHAHNVEVPVNVTRLYHTLDRDGKPAVDKPRHLGRETAAVVRIAVAAGRGSAGPVLGVPLETFAAHRRLGRFTLRYSSVTVAAGMVLEIKA